MKRNLGFLGLVLLGLSKPAIVYSQIIQNCTIYNIDAFAISCCRDLKIDSCLIMIKGGNLTLKYGLLGQSSEIDRNHSYYILVDNGLSFNETLLVLAHELVHVKQMKSGELRFTNDSIYFMHTAYRNSAKNHKHDPHELQAVSTSLQLYEKNRNILLLYN